MPTGQGDDVVCFIERLLFAARNCRRGCCSCAVRQLAEPTMPGPAFIFVTVLISARVRRRGRSTGRKPYEIGPVAGRGIKMTDPVESNRAQTKI